MYFGFTMNCYGFFYFYYFLMDATLIFTLVFHGFFLATLKITNSIQRFLLWNLASV